MAALCPPRLDEPTLDPTLFSEQAKCSACLFVCSYMLWGCDVFYGGGGVFLYYMRCSVFECDFGNVGVWKKNKIEYTNNTN